MSPNATSVLVTGGAGFIGSHLVERLAATGEYRVTIVDDFNDFYSPSLKRANARDLVTLEGVELVEADILDDAAMTRIFGSGRFDVVVHLAARAGVRPSLADPILYQRVNVEGTYRLLEQSRRHCVPRFLFASSSSVYGVRSKVPFSEDDPVNRPASPYAATKIAGECACHTYTHLFGIESVCLRFFTAYGPRQRPDLAIRKFTDLLAAGKPLTLFGDGRSARDYTYVGDVVECVARAIEHRGEPFEVINVGGEHPVRLVDLVEMLSELLGVRPEIDWQPDQPGDVPITCADGSKAKRLFDFVPRVEIREGLRRFVAWYRDRRDGAAPSASAATGGHGSQPRPE
jgi:UDP-glucuronate 4-epimerase